MKKFMCKTIIILLALAILPLGIHATEKTTLQTSGAAEKSVEKAAIEFMQNYTKNIYLYETNDLRIQTAYAIEEKVRTAISCEYPAEQSYSRTRKYLQESKLSDNSHYIIEKAKYQKELRLLHEVTHEQFTVMYEIHKININDMYAQVFLTEDKTFYYSGETIQSALAEDFENWDKNASILKINRISSYFSCPSRLSKNFLNRCHVLPKINRIQVRGNKRLVIRHREGDFGRLSIWRNASRYLP